MRLFPLLLAILLAGCGVSETATVAATAGAAKAKEAEQAKAAPAQVQGKLDEAFKQAEQKREAAEGR
ncbi:MAG: hypothetical protein R3E40_07030 [Rhodocyclaceae bacterium]|jgi:hypothetical protein|nr:hypothetical protein [Rhodocyclaceae bacterium]PKO69579.1 MAG: hypothetical protein CVU20_11585 [Betaproteobacteria bacterium HGW-Betaproteobacteria-14]